MQIDVEAPNRWYLASPRSYNTGDRIDPRIFTAGKVVDSFQPMVIGMRRAGIPLNITYADFDLPIVDKPTAGLLEHEAEHDLQLIPITVEGSEEEYRILNVTSLVDCLDLASSEIQWWTLADGRPEKVGMPRMIATLKIDHSKVMDQRIFRIANWKIALIVSQEIRSLLESKNVQGVRFTPV